MHRCKLSSWERKGTCTGIEKAKKGRERKQSGKIKTKKKGSFGVKDEMKGALLILIIICSSYASQKRRKRKVQCHAKSSKTRSLEDGERTYTQTKCGEVFILIQQAPSLRLLIKYPPIHLGIKSMYLRPGNNAPLHRGCVVWREREVDR